MIDDLLIHSLSGTTEIMLVSPVYCFNQSYTKELNLKSIHNLNFKLVHEFKERANPDNKTIPEQL